VFTSIRLGGVLERVQRRQAQVPGGSEPVKFGQDGGDLGGAHVLVAVVCEGLPERDYVPVTDDWLIDVDVDDADGWVVFGF
jgi:hypothetical protein